jgi:prepilin-type N-terminal cleavage/methylation domain-containing protein
MMTRLIWRLRPSEGVTLIEMSIVMVILGAIMAFTLQSVASFQRSASGGVHRIENLNEARILMQVITKDIRTAAKLDAATPPFPDGPTGVYPVDGITRADDFEVVFLANLNQSTQCPKLIRLYIDNVGRLIEAVTAKLGAASSPRDADPDAARGRYIANSSSPSSRTTTRRRRPAEPIRRVGRAAAWPMPCRSRRRPLRSGTPACRSRTRRSRTACGSRTCTTTRPQRSEVTAPC